MAPLILMPGDFELVHMGGTGGALIRIGQWLNGDGFADYEHARIYVGNGRCVEAEPDGARIAPCTSYDSVPHVWSSGYLTPTLAQREAMTAAALGLLGTGYSWADYFALAAKRLHIPAPGLNAYVKSSKRLICSQLVAKVWADAGVPLLGTEFTGDVTPGDLHRVLVDHGLGSGKPA